MCQVQKFAGDAGSCLIDTVPLLTPRNITVFCAPGAQRCLASPAELMEEGVSMCLGVQANSGEGGSVQSERGGCTH